MPHPWLSKQNAFIFRITHIDNVRWMLNHGLHCRNGEQDPDFVTIGLPDVIDRRHRRQVPVAPRGTLSDYVPFYFTPFSPMAYKINTGHGVPHVNQQDIVVLIASLRDIDAEGVPFLFTDRHAMLHYAEFFHSLEDLDQIDWTRLRNRDFRHDDNDPEKVERYQAEALIHGHLPIERLRLIGCRSDLVAERVRAWAEEDDADVRVEAIPRLYF